MKITVEGIDYVEDALLKPDLPTQHFPPVSILITGDIHHSQIQHGNIGSPRRSASSPTTSSRFGWSAT